MLSIVQNFSMALSILCMSPVQATAVNHLEVNQDQTPIYEEHNSKMDVVGYLNKEQQYPIKKDIKENYWTIKYGNSVAYVSKDSSQIAKKVTYKNLNHYKHNSFKAFITNQDTPVYDNSTGKLVQFATIKANRRYPTIASSGNWWMVDFDGRLGYVNKAITKEDKGIPVLMYHHFLKNSENKKFRTNTTITPEAFTEQMDFLAKEGYTTITTKELEEYVQGKRNLPGKTTLITIDDGQKSVLLYAYPALKKNNLKATAFMITSRITENPSNFNPDNLQNLSKGEMEEMKDVFEYQGHTTKLHNISKEKKSDVVTKPYDIVKKDFEDSRIYLNAHSMAYPFGQYKQETLKITKEAGFKSAFTTKNGYVNIGDDLLQLNRFGIEPKYTIKKFEELVSQEKVNKK
ncbi:polysaccharide deacetylase family protein [Bacillus cereus]|uniref:polysaccharide deacetylase family protein n=1 Tax=Bacillus cereus TaxID=1396 RepID=UPI000B4A74DF|nr:polysaccharide deacetylase family protein [Bacillus cereus]